MANLRYIYNLKQQELADAIGRDRSLISKIERGGPVPLLIARAIRDAFHDLIARW